MHARGSEPNEERLACLVGAFHEINAALHEFLIDCLHPLAGKRASVLALLLAYRTEARVRGRIERVRSVAVKHTTRTKSLPEGWIFRIELLLRLLFGIEVIEIAEELVEPMHCRKELVSVPEMILSELPAGIAERFQQFSKRGVFITQPFLSAGQPDLEQPGAKCALACDE